MNGGTAGGARAVCAGMQIMIDSKARFSSRVDNYIRYRPGYPRGLVGLLARECGLTPDSIVADIGSGTGLLSLPFLKNGNLVHGVEPNREMRLAGEALLRDHARFHSVAGSAEQTGLPAASVDLLVAGQAFHWFDHARCREEFARILRPGGWVVLVWNYRRHEASAFLQAYEHLLLRFCPEYPKILDRDAQQRDVGAFFGRRPHRLECLANRQDFDFQGLEGRHLSQSYVEQSGEYFEPMMRELRVLFDAHNTKGKVAFEYETRVYFGRLTDLRN